MFKSVVETFLDFLYPPQCMVCRGFITRGESRAVCDACDGLIEPIKDSCLFCGRPLNGLELCSNCAESVFGFEKTISFTYYSDTVQKVIHDLKFNNRPQNAVKMVEYMSGRMDFSFMSEISALVPIPMHEKRERERGYNQSELLAKALCKKHNKRFIGNVLKRVRPTPPQRSLSMIERRTNLKGAFLVVKPRLIEGLHLLLIDDVCTTGSTMDECSRILKESGAAKVSRFSFAKTIKNF